MTNKYTGHCFCGAVTLEVRLYPALELSDLLLRSFLQTFQMILEFSL